MRSASVDVEVLADDDFAGVAGGDFASDLFGGLPGEDQMVEHEEFGFRLPGDAGDVAR